MQITDDNLILRSATESDLKIVWQGVYQTPDWREFDAPYFAQQDESVDVFERGMFSRFVAGRDALLIELDGRVVSSVTSYWENQKTRWLEVGITLYSSGTWGKSIGRRALKLWIDHLFQQHELERVGLSTWSGNPRMIACAKSLGLQVEGCLRKVRYFNDEYHDAIKMGVLREEWSDLHHA